MNNILSFVNLATKESIYNMKLKIFVFFKLSIHKLQNPFTQFILGQRVKCARMGETSL